MSNDKTILTAVLNDAYERKFFIEFALKYNLNKWDMQHDHKNVDEAYAAHLQQQKLRKRIVNKPKTKKYSLLAKIEYICLITGVILFPMLMFFLLYNYIGIQTNQAKIILIIFDFILLGYYWGLIRELEYNKKSGRKNE